MFNILSSLPSSLARCQGLDNNNNNNRATTKEKPEMRDRTMQTWPHDDKDDADDSGDDDDDNGTQHNGD